MACSAKFSTDSGIGCHCPALVGQSDWVNFLLEQLVDAPFRPQLEQVLNVLSLDGLTDVLANGPSDWWLDRGFGLEALTQLAMPLDKYESLTRFLIALGDRHLDSANPITDVSISTVAFPIIATLGIGRLRVHAVLRSSVSDATALSIRVHRQEVPTLESLHEADMFSNRQLDQLRQIMATRANFIVSGGAGCGKTTLLRAMLSSDPKLRTVVVEDTAEIVPYPGHGIGLQARQANIEGVGAISIDELARQALRMRPDRLVIGEVRGTEVEVLLQAMNTGHSGSAGTIHANSATDVYQRLRVLGLAAGFTDDAFKAAASSAIQWVIHLTRRYDTRTISSIGALCP